MYFPTSAAKRLSTVPPLPNIPLENALGIIPSPRKSFFALLTRNGVAVWRVRVRVYASAHAMLIVLLAHRRPFVPVAYTRIDIRARRERASALGS